VRLLIDEEARDEIADAAVYYEVTARATVSAS
jgi:hypothetical protein